MLLKTIDIYFCNGSKKSFTNIVEWSHVNGQQLKLVDWEGKMILVNWVNINFLVDGGSVEV